MSALSSYDKNSQIEVLALTLTRGKTVLDMMSVMDQFIIYEDLFQGAISASMIFRDQVNLIGTLPVVGGEMVSIQYRTPIYTDIVSLNFVVYKVGDRGISNDSVNLQVNELFLCTPEVWWASNNDVCSSQKGTYTDIMKTIIGLTGSKKKFVDAEESVGIVDYAIPAISAFQAIKFAAGRANTKSVSPMFFWETAHGFHIKSLKEIYRAQYNKFIYIEDRSTNGVDSDADKVFNTVYSYDYGESNNRLAQYTANAFGAENYSVDFTNKRIFKNINTYDTMFNGQDIKLNKYPLNDDNKAAKEQIKYVPFTADLSHIGTFNRRATMAFMSNLRIVASLPGDSQLKAGDIIYLEIPSRSGLSIGAEPYSSGKWLVRSIKHMINKNTYSMICELTKDSFDAQVQSS